MVRTKEKIQTLIIMKTIKNLTPEQAIEIAKLIYPFPECVKSEYKFKYQPYDSSWYEDAREYIRVEWDGILAADKVVPLFIEINTNLDCYCYYSTAKGAERMPLRNQNSIQKKFIEWDIEPIPFGVNTHIISNEKFNKK